MTKFQQGDVVKCIDAKDTNLCHGVRYDVIWCSEKFVALAGADVFRSELWPYIFSVDRFEISNVLPTHGYPKQPKTSYVAPNWSERNLDGKLSTAYNLLRRCAYELEESCCYDLANEVKSFLGEK